MLWIRRLVENNFDWHALHHFDIVPGGVLWRDQTKPCAGSCLNAVYVSFKDLIRISVNAYIYWLPGYHFADLALFEIGGDPDVTRHDREQRLSNLDQGAFFDRLACHTAVFSRIDLRIGEFEFCLFDFCPQLFGGCTRCLRLRLAHGHLLGRSVGLSKTTERFTNASLCTTDLRLRLSRSLTRRNMRGAGLVHLCLIRQDLLASGIELSVGRACCGNGLVQLLF